MTAWLGNHKAAQLIDLRDLAASWRSGRLTSGKDFFRSRLAWTLAVVLLMLGALSSMQGFLNAVRPNGSQDFQWSVSRQLLKHENPYRLFIEGGAGTMPVYPASAEIFLWPVAALNFDDAKWVWAATNMLFAIGSIVLVARITEMSGVLMVSLLGLFLASTPVRTTVGNGQHGLFSFFFFLLAIDLQRHGKTPAAALCLAASWLKYTVTFPLSLIFIRREWRKTFALACAVHLGLTLFLAFWTGETPLNLVLGPLMLAGNSVTASMFDVIAIGRYIGLSSLIGPASVGIALLIVVAALMFKSKNDLIFDLSLLSLLSLVWGYHWQYDYFVLIIPLAYSLKRLRQDTIDSADILTILSVFLIWFVQRIVDSAVAWTSGTASLSVASNVIFWLTCLVFYAAFISYLTSAFMRQRRAMLTIPRD